MGQYSGSSIIVLAVIPPSFRFDAPEPMTLQEPSSFS